MPFDKEIRMKASVVESHAAQVRQEALEFLYESGEEYTDALSEKIGELIDSDNEGLHIIGLLAEIGFCSVLCGAVEAG